MVGGWRWGQIGGRRGSFLCVLGQSHGFQPGYEQFSYSTRVFFFVGFVFWRENFGSFFEFFSLKEGRGQKTNKQEKQKRVCLILGQKELKTNVDRNTI